MPMSLPAAVSASTVSQVELAAVPRYSYSFIVDSFLLSKLGSVALDQVAPMQCVPETYAVFLQICLYSLFSPSAIPVQASLLPPQAVSDAQEKVVEATNAHMTTDPGM